MKTELIYPPGHPYAGMVNQKANERRPETPSEKSGIGNNGDRGTKRRILLYT